MPYHGLIDWRLGMSLIRIMCDVNYNLGVDKNFAYSELADWMDNTINIRDNFIASFFPSRAQKIDGLIPGFSVTIKGQQIAVFFLHPFWERDASKNPLIGETVALSGFMQYKFIDTFNALRRPGWCYENIFQS